MGPSAWRHPTALPRLARSVRGLRLWRSKKPPPPAPASAQQSAAGEPRVYGDPVCTLLYVNLAVFVPFQTLVGQQFQMLAFLILIHGKTCASPSPRVQSPP